jgi:hypothetical protein
MRENLRPHRPGGINSRRDAEKLSKAIGREIQYVDVPEEAMMGALLSVGLPQWQVEGLIEDDAHYRRGEASTISSGIHDATGMLSKSFDDFARDYALSPKLCASDGWTERTLRTSIQGWFLRASLQAHRTIP